MYMHQLGYKGLVIVIIFLVIQSDLECTSHGAVVSSSTIGGIRVREDILFLVTEAQ